jgi:hypothetical protein
VGGAAGAGGEARAIASLVRIGSLRRASGAASCFDRSWSRRQCTTSGGAAHERRRAVTRSVRGRDAEGGDT